MNEAQAKVEALTAQLEETTDFLRASQAQAQAQQIALDVANRHIARLQKRIEALTPKPEPTKEE